MEQETQTGMDAIEKLQEIIDDVDITMMCTLGENNEMESRPMNTVACDSDGTLWFFSNRHSAKTDEIEHDRHVLLCYSNPSSNTYACVHGISTIVDDKAKMEELWNPALKAWFPRGGDDPQLTLIRVVPHHAEYWDDKTSRMVTFFKTAVSAIIGSERDSGEYGELRF